MGASKKVSNIPDNVLYDSALLRKLDFASIQGVLSPPITATAPGEPWLQVRPLEKEDYDKGFCELLSQLTSVGNVSRLEFDRQFIAMKSAGEYYVTVIEDTRINRIIGSATLVTEFKFIHGCSLRGRLEDVVVNNTYRGKQLGKLWMDDISAAVLPSSSKLLKMAAPLPKCHPSGKINYLCEERIVMTVTLLAKHLGCYKMSLDCKDNLIPFYKTLGYKLEPGNSNSMIVRYPETPKVTGIS